MLSRVGQSEIANPSPPPERLLNLGRGATRGEADKFNVAPVEWFTTFTYAFSQRILRLRTKKKARRWIGKHLVKNSHFHVFTPPTTIQSYLGHYYTVIPRRRNTEPTTSDRPIWPGPSPKRTDTIKFLIGLVRNYYGLYRMTHELSTARY